MPEHYMNGKRNGLLRESMLVNVKPAPSMGNRNDKLNSKPADEPRPIQPAPQDERPPSSGSDDSKPTKPNDDNLVLLGIGALILVAFGMMR
tara:strand:+ start:373 stop:645 length:273 start_codon:yes stop_codon:yes gene_type:complete